MNSDSYRNAWAKENVSFAIGPVGVVKSMQWFVRTHWLDVRSPNSGAGWYGGTFMEAIDKAINATDLVMTENPS